MTTDLKLIKELGNEIGIELEEKVGIDITQISHGAYQRNTKGHVSKLALDENGLEHLPHNIFNFNNLEYLSLYSNQIQELPPEIGRLTNLITLYLEENQIRELPPEIGFLANLKTLFLQKNKLRELPPEIGWLNNLKTLDLRSNLLSELPSEISQLTNLTNLPLHGNNLKQPPYGIATGDNNIDKIRIYFQELEAQGEDYIYEAKLILVGEPGAGKTSLAKKLMNPEYELNDTEPMTKGIDVEKWQFPYSNDISFQCNIWDFGGQDIMHATHKYFLTKRSLYVLMADNRKEDTDFYYWLNMLELLSGNSPVLIVLNEKHKYKKYVPENILNSFNSVKNVYNVNLADNSGLTKVSKAIQDYLCKLPHVGDDPIPKKWVKIREDLEKEKRNFITRGKYLKLCEENDIDDEQQAGYISEFLHDLGVILHFQKDLILNNTIILNTRWATEAVYQILFDNTIIENCGEFDNSDLGRVWCQPHYRNKHSELLQLMLNFEICYQIEKTQRYIIPELLPEKSLIDTEFWAAVKSKGKGILHFEYRYDFMPKGIISRLIVRMNKDIFQKQHWKSGVVLKVKESRAEIVEYFNSRVLRIRIAGNDRLEALTIIRGSIQNLNDTFENLIAHEMVPCNCPECLKSEVPHFFDYDELKQYKQEGEQFIKCRVGNLKNVDVLSLISDVFFKEEVKMKGKRRDRIHIKNIIENKQEVKTTGGKAKSRARSIATSNLTVDIDLKVVLPSIQDDFAGLKSSLAEENPELKEDLNRIEDSLDDVTPKSGKKEFVQPMNKMRRFLEKAKDENSDIHKAIKGAKKGIETAQKVCKTYNKFAQWLGLDMVLDLFL